MKKVCLVDGCERAAKSRGLCSSCYQSARAHVAAGKTTWELLAHIGMALEPKAVAGGRSSKFQEALRKQSPTQQEQPGPGPAPVLSPEDELERVLPRQLRCPAAEAPVVSKDSKPAALLTGGRLSVTEKPLPLADMTSLHNTAACLEQTPGEPLEAVRSANGGSPADEPAEACDAQPPDGITVYSEMTSEELRKAMVHGYKSPEIAPPAETLLLKPSVEPASRLVPSGPGPALVGADPSTAPVRPDDDATASDGDIRADNETDSFTALYGTAEGLRESKDRLRNASIEGGADAG